MTHQRPVPAGNQSPYPLQEAPHPQRDAALERLPAGGTPATGRVVVGTLLAVATAVVAAAGLWTYLSRPKPKRRKAKAKAKRGKR